MGKKKIPVKPPAVMAAQAAQSAAKNGTTLGGKKNAVSHSSDRSGDEGPLPLCLQCELLSTITKEVLSIIHSTPTAVSSNSNFHLVLKELQSNVLEIGRCCGRPLDDYRSGSYSSRSRSSESETPAPAAFWDNLKGNVEKEERKKTPFQAPPTRQGKEKKKGGQAAAPNTETPTAEVVQIS